MTRGMHPLLQRQLVWATVEAPKTVNRRNSAELEAPLPKNNILVVVASENHEYYKIKLN